MAMRGCHVLLAGCDTVSGCGRESDTEANDFDLHQQRILLPYLPGRYATTYTFTTRDTSTSTLSKMVKLFLIPPVSRPCPPFHPLFTTLIHPKGAPVPLLQINKFHQLSHRYHISHSFIPRHPPIPSVHWYPSMFGVVCLAPAHSHIYLSPYTPK